jgi:oxygenase
LTVDGSVIVVGAGPVGLMLAGELRLGGCDVLVLERLTAPATESRASTLHARTMEIFDERGLLETLGTPPNVHTGHFGGIPLDLGLPSTYPGQWKVPQRRTEALLEDRAARLGAEVRRGHELRALTEQADHVQVEAAGPDGPVSLRARYVVGCDGERSAVRRLAGFDFPGHDATRELLRADVAGIDVPDRRFERHANGLAIASRGPDGVTRVMMHGFGWPAEHRGEDPAFTEVVAGWARVTGEDIGHGTPVWLNAFGDACRQATRYRKGRVLLAGDAAHLQMPVGGQALNLGLQDAVNLGWKLAAHVRGQAGAELLDTYHDERRPAGRRVLDNIETQAQLLLGGHEVNALRGLFGELLQIDAVRRHLAGMISGLDVRFDVGPGDHPLLGARLPHQRLRTDEGTVRTPELFRSGCGVLLDLAGAGLERTVAPWKDRVRTVSAAPAHELGFEAALVRPDGHLAWVDGSTVELREALHRWFSEPEEGLG